MIVCMLTTTDNPFDPIDQYEEWENYDLQKGYCSSSYLSRIARTSDQLSDYENEKEIERAIDEIVEMDLIGNVETNNEVHYKKIKREIIENVKKS